MFLNLPPELHLHVASLLTTKRLLDPQNHLPEHVQFGEFLIAPLPRVATDCPDLGALSALERTCTTLHNLLNQLLYTVCVRDYVLGRLAILHAVQTAGAGEALFDRLAALGVPLDTEYIFGENKATLLHIAARDGHAGLVAKLLERYGEEGGQLMAYKRVRDKDTTPLDGAAYAGHLEVVKLLAPIEPHAIMLAEDARVRQVYLFSALERCIANPNTLVPMRLQILKYLIEKGADVRTGEVLAAAACTGDVAVVEFLIAAGAPVNSPAVILPALHASVRVRSLDTARTLLDAGADVNVLNLESQTALHYAVIWKSPVELFRLLLERGVNIHHQDHRGDTALHWAARRGMDCGREIVELLFEFGAVEDIGVPNAEGWTTFAMAMQGQRVDMVKAMEQRILDPVMREEARKWLRGWRVEGY